MTGAVASESVSEALKGSLRMVGNHPFECKSISRLDCEAYKPSRWETRF